MAEYKLLKTEGRAKRAEFHTDSCFYECGNDRCD